MIPIINISLLYVIIKGFIKVHTLIFKPFVLNLYFELGKYVLEKLKNEGYYYGALLYAFFIPFHQKLTTLALIVWAVLSVFSLKKKTVYMNWPWMVFPALYLTYFIGFFVSQDPYFRFLETKLSFLIFPLLFVSHNYTDVQRKKMLRLFLYGLLVAGLLCLSFSLSINRCSRGLFLF